MSTATEDLIASSIANTRAINNIAKLERELKYIRGLLRDYEDAQGAEPCPACGKY